MSKSKPVEPVVPVFTKEELPSNWDLVPIAEICLPVEKVNPKERLDSEFDYIDISGIDNNLFRIAETKRYTGRQAPSRARQLVRAGDIVFSTVRTYLKNIALVRPEHDQQIASTGFCVLRPAKHEFSKYLYYYVQYEPFLNQLARFQRGTSYPAVRDGDVTAQLIPVPPKDEAARIVAEIEKQFSRLDEAVANLKRVKANLKRYKAAVLKAAVEGKLTSSDRDRWKKRLLGDVLTSIQAGKSFKCEERPPRENEVGVVKVSAVTWGTYDELETKTASTQIELTGDFSYNLAISCSAEQTQSSWLEHV